MKLSYINITIAISPIFGFLDESSAIRLTEKMSG